MPQLFEVAVVQTTQDPDAGVRYWALDTLKGAIEYVSPKNGGTPLGINSEGYEKELSTNSEEYEKRLPQFFKTLYQATAEDQDPAIWQQACKFLLETLDAIAKYGPSKALTAMSSLLCSKRDLARSWILRFTRCLPSY